MLICGGIDLSVGSVLALSSAVIGISVAAGFSIPVAALAGVTAGGLAGLVNGLLKPLSPVAGIYCHPRDVGGGGGGISNHRLPNRVYPSAIRD